jgi:hypothetical protein
VIQRLLAYAGVFGEDDPEVYILAPPDGRPIPAGDLRRGTAWIFRAWAPAHAFAAWMRGRHGVDTVPLAIKLRTLVAGLGDRDLTFVLDPKPRAGGYGAPLHFKAPLPQ